MSLAAARTTPAPKATANGIEIHCEQFDGETVCLPPSVRTLDGFRTWRTSNDSPRREHGKYAYLAGELYIEADNQGIQVPPTAYTLGGFREWAKSAHFPQRGQFSFLNGKLYIDLTMEEIENHNWVKTETVRVIGNINRREDRGKVCSDKVLITNPKAGVSNEPDASFVSWETLEKGLARLISKNVGKGPYLEIQGTPDWLLEIVSPSSVNKDTRELKVLYHRAGIPEYWLVDARGKELYFQILIWGKKAYRPASKRAGWQRSKVFGHWFRMTRKRDRLGLWQYHLETRK